jgi:hypothetical protein
MLLKEPEDIQMLRHRYGRTIEIWVAYNTFLKYQVKIGDNYICKNKTVVDQTKQTLLTTYYSYIYSLFDPSGTNFTKISQKHHNDLPERTKEVLKEILELWKVVEQPLNRIRHNIGFHGGKELKNSKSGYSAFLDPKLNPWAIDCLINLLRVFFRDINDTYETKEGFLIEITHKEADQIYADAKLLKSKIEAPSFIELIDKYNEGKISKKEFLRNLQTSPIPVGHRNATLKKSSNSF